MRSNSHQKTSLFTPFLVFMTMVGATVRTRAARLAPHDGQAHGSVWAEEKAQSSLGDILLGSITLALAFVVSLVFFPIITSSVATAQADSNTTSQDSAMLALLPTIFVVVLVVAGVNRLVSGIRSFRQ